MKKILASLIAVFMVISCMSVAAFAENDSSIGLTEWMANGKATGVNAAAFLSGAENRPSREELETMLSLANTYFQCHMLTGTHFIVVQDADKQAEVMSMFTQFAGLDTSGTVMVLVMADGVKDQEHHAAQYFPGPTQTNGGNPEYWNMYYGILEAGWASGYLNLLARDMGYRTRVFAALNIPNAETGEVDFFGTGGNFAYINGENWDIKEYMTSKDGSDIFDHYVLALDDEIPLEGNVTLLCAMLIGKINEADAVTGATQTVAFSERRMANYDFWDWDEDYVPESAEEVNIADLPDGTYPGMGSDLHGSITVYVTIENGKIVSVAVDETSKEIMLSTEDVLSDYFDSVVAAQSAEVDGISGATTESAALKEAINNALHAAAVVG